MTLRADPKYPSRRAYVVKLRGDASPPALTGRVENLVTGKQLEFTSGSELLDCIARDLHEHLNDLPADLAGVER